MRPNRRQFLAAAPVIAASLSGEAGRSSAPAKAPAIRQRKSISGLKGNSPDVESLRAAIQSMRDGKGKNGMMWAATDLRNWKLQAAMHGTQSAFGNCQHQNWFFLPWHRLFLAQFEAIVRDLSGDINFALPYWDWTENRTLPAFMFAGDSLDDATRRPDLKTLAIPDDIYNRTMNKTVIAKIRAIEDFETFGGFAVDQLGGASIQGRLESAPHNEIHNWVNGNMATGASPLDPVFWLHHCNVDRLWGEWMRLHKDELPTDKKWLEQTFPGFSDTHGDEIAEPMRVPVKGCLNTADLGYTYDSRPDPVSVSIQAGDLRRVVTTGPLAEEAKDSNDHSASFALKPSPAWVKKVNAIATPVVDAPKESVRLVIRGITPPSDPGVIFDVFLNCQKLSVDTPISDASYVGSCAFFGHGEHGHGKDAKGDGTVSFVFDLNNDLVKLYGDRPLKDDEPLQVGIVARQSGKDGKLSPYQYKKINPKFVQLSTVRRDRMR